MKNTNPRRRVTQSSVDADNRNAASADWQVQTAKARFSEVFRLARNHGPQRITKQGKESVVMVAEEQYNLLVGKSAQPRSLVQFFRQSPLVGIDLKLATRSRSRPRY
jgi:prevent-host-death family protein